MTKRFQSAALREVYDEMVGRDTRPMDVWLDRNDATRLTSELGRSGHAQAMPITFRRKDGALNPSLFSLRLVELKGRLVWLATVMPPHAGVPYRQEKAEIDALAAQLAPSEA